MVPHVYRLADDWSDDHGSITQIKTALRSRDVAGAIHRNRLAILAPYGR